MNHNHTYSINISAPNLINLCIDRHTDEQIAGRIYHFYDGQPLEFVNILNLLSRMEELFDRIGYPQVSTRSRMFSPASEKTHSGTTASPGGAGTKRAQRPAKTVSSDDLLSHRGEKATFLIHVRYRQNSEWQGTFVCPETKQQLNFSSTLDFIKLVSNLLDSL